MASIATFNFDGAAVRTVTLENGEPGFVGKDVAVLLGYVNPTDAFAKHCKGVAIRYPLPTAGGMQEVRVLSEPDVLRLIVSSKLPAAEKFEKWVFEEVLPSIRKTGGYALPRNASASAIEAMGVAEALANMLRLEGSARLGVARKALELTAPHLLPLAPVYAVDAPTGSASAASSETTGSLNTLLKKHGVTFSAIKVNQILIDFGLLEERTRPSTSGAEQRKFKAITEAGLQYGKNVTNPANQKEVQPHWYESTFSRLLQHVGLSLAVK